MPPKRIAIVGSGVSGIGALYALQQTPHEVHLYEADSRLGGHTNTVMFYGNGKPVAVDTGFIVLNTVTYPNFIAFLKEIGVETTPTDMTFAVTRDGGAFEWSGTSLDALFAQRSNLLRPGMWRMIFDIVRFNQFALDLLTDPRTPASLTIGEYLEREGYSANFRDDYLIPMTACVWSTGPDKCALEFPAVTLVRFLWNHHLLNTITERPSWLTIPGGSKRYIDAVLKKFPKDRVHLSSAIRSVKNIDDGKVSLELSNGKSEIFDQVVLACHGNQAWDIVSATATLTEKDILSAFVTTPNTAYIHSDTSLMPRRRLAWSSWNYLTTTTNKSPQERTHSGNLVEQKVSLTYNMNILQHLPTTTYGDVLVTLNPETPPDPSLTQGTYLYHHPLYNAAAIRSQNRLPEIQGKRGIWYAGAWTCYGFHEDGFSSGVRVAVDSLGGKVGWDVVDAKFVRGRKPSIGPLDHALRIVLWLIQYAIVLLIDLTKSGRKSKQV